MTKHWFVQFVILIFAGFMVTCSQESQVRIVLISGANEYFSHVSLPDYKTHLENRYDNVEVTLLQANGELNQRGEYSNLDGLENLSDCDVAVVFTRRLTIDKSQLRYLQDYVDRGGGLVAIRTASHGFQGWLEFDNEVLGGNYHGHSGGSPEDMQKAPDDTFIPQGQPEGVTQSLDINEETASHPILAGVTDFRSRYSMYYTDPVAEDVTVLMNASVPGEESRPAVWSREYDSSRICYIQPGGLQDFGNDTYLRLLDNALSWAAEQDFQKKSLEELSARDNPEGSITLRLRVRQSNPDNKNALQTVTFDREIPLANTAVLICDMWDQHWCDGANARCDSLAIKMNPVVALAREKGIQVIHAPSSTMFYYVDHPQYRRVKEAPDVTSQEPLFIPRFPLPIDDSDGGCDTDNEPYSAWTRQTPRLEIGEHDAISDNGNDIYNFLEFHDIEYVLLMGVHTNMCVLNRSFAIRRMTRVGKQYILVRDLTDAMYDPEDPPYVSHAEGTDLVIEHIEQYWCPTVTSDNLDQELSEVPGL